MAALQGKEACKMHVRAARGHAGSHNAASSHNMQLPGWLAVQGSAGFHNATLAVASKAMHVIILGC